MLDVVVDAATLAIPEHEGEAEAWIGRLDALDQLRAEACVRVAPTAKGIDTLFGGNDHPYGDRMRDWPWLQYEDQVTRVADALNRSQVFEDLIGMVLAVDEPSCTPDDHLAGRSSEWVEVHHEVLAIAAVQEAAWPDHPATLVFSPLPLGESVHGRVVEVRGQALVEWVDGGEKRTELQTYAASVHLVDSVEAAIRSVDCIALWRIEGCERLALAAYTASHQDPFVWPLGGEWKFHPEFLERANRCGCKGDSQRIRALLDACKNALLDNALGKPHPLRWKITTSADRVRASDGALAKRRDLPGDDMHLHYWKRGDYIEFGSIVIQHDDGYIPE